MSNQGDEDEWAMFGSDESDEEDNVSLEETYTNAPSDDPNARLRSNATIHNDQSLSQGNVVQSDDPIMLQFKKMVKSSVHSCVQDLIFFIIQTFLKANKSLPLSQRFFATSPALPASNSIGISSNEKNYEKNLSWNYIYMTYVESSSVNLEQRCVNIILPEDHDNVNKDLVMNTDGSKMERSNDASSKMDDFKSDAASLFRCFEADIKHVNENGKDFEPSMNALEEESYGTRYRQESNLRRQLIPGGFLLLSSCIMMTSHTSSSACSGESDETLLQLQRVFEKMKSKSPEYFIRLWKHGDSHQRKLIFTDAVWDIENASMVHSSTKFIPRVGISNCVKSLSLFTICLRKRPCPTNTLSCPWRGNGIVESETWIQYERRILAESTISCSIAERKGIFRHDNSNSSSASKGSSITRVTPDTIQKGIMSLQRNGFLVLRNLYSTEDIKSLSNAISSDFDLATSILSETRSIDIINPGNRSSSEGNGKSRKNEPLNYREMAMREDLRVDLRDGPSISALRQQQSAAASKSSTLSRASPSEPTIIDMDSIVKQELLRIQDCDKNDSGTAALRLRYHPVVIEIMQGLFNPLHDESGKIPGSRDGSDEAGSSDKNVLPLYKGNFGRWNFSGKGPNGSPQPLKIGQVASVISLPGAADQAIHADTPHIFETHDCLPCHYANLFILGDCSQTPAKKDAQSNGASSASQYDLDGIFTGNSQIGGTAFIHGSHSLSVTARLTAEDDVVGRSAASAKKEAKDEMYRRIIRPSLELGDAVIFDTRCLHFGLANQSVYKRPMLYVNFTHTWFHDPKNWNNNESIFGDKKY